MQWKACLLSFFSLHYLGQSLYVGAPVKVLTRTGSNAVINEVPSGGFLNKLVTLVENVDHALSDSFSSSSPTYRSKPRAPVIDKDDEARKIEKNDYVARLRVQLDLEHALHSLLRIGGTRCTTLEETELRRLFERMEHLQRYEQLLASDLLPGKWKLVYIAKGDGNSPLKPSEAYAMEQEIGANGEMKAITRARLPFLPLQMQVASEGTFTPIDEGLTEAAVSWDTRKVRMGKVAVPSLKKDIEDSRMHVCYLSEHYRLGRAEDQDTLFVFERVREAKTA
ncbi:unnamed protein product [Chrysoparadoxa australica]